MKFESVVEFHWLKLEQGGLQPAIEKGKKAVNHLYYEKPSIKMENIKERNQTKPRFLTQIT